jgi:hypothetical protein
VPRRVDSSLAERPRPALAAAAARILPIPLLKAPGSANGTAALASSSELGVRWSRVMAAQARIATGFYDRCEVRASLADAVLQELRRR